MDVLYLYQKVSKTRLDQRCIELDSGDILFNARDKRGPVRFSAAEWKAVRSDHEASIAPAARFFKWSIWLTPVITLGLMIVGILFMPGFGGLVRWLDRTFPPQLAVGVWLTWPALIGLVVDGHATIRANAALDRRVAGMARETSTILPARGIANALEIIVALFVGPHLLLGVWGSLNPNAYYNTPLSGTRLGLIDVAGIAALLILVALRRGRSAVVRYPPADAPSAEPARKPPGFGRRRGPIGDGPETTPCPPRRQPA
jgi:hypothetical protein